jgi:hypothetical protein
MANVLQLNQSQIFNGLGTLTFTVPITGTYSVGAQVTVPQAIATGDGAGSGKGPGSGAGGGDATGFSVGGVADDTGGVGHGFGPVANVYPQPPLYGSNQTSGSAVSSGVSVVVNDNGSPVYTAPAFAAAQSALQFKTGFQFTAGHTITVVLASSTLTDEQTSGVTSNVFIQQGY